MCRGTKEHMKAIITCGPSYEPVDQVRRLTNFSTGHLGVALAGAFSDAGHEVFCFKGEMASWPEPVRAHAVESFSTNADLASKLERLSRTTRIDAVFHAAALCDYRVARVLDAQGHAIQSAKFATRSGELTLVLEPAPKVLPQMRHWFPHAIIIGWKYEMEGTRDDAFSKAWHQMRHNQTDACVLNGAAYGLGFALCTPPENVAECPTLDALLTALLGWAESKIAHSALQ
jgi:phosphopantothenoylcysteine decarboxylase/phosphopantothenate--cysteine ligase